MLRILLITMAVAGLILLLRGFVGRRVGTGPHCRCGYELEGLANRNTCPECGRAVWDGVNVRLGRHERRRGTVVVGAAMLVFGIAAFVTIVPPWRNSYAWQPNWLLVLQGPDGGGQWSLEVIDRLRGGRLGRDSIDALVGAARTRFGGGRAAKSLSDRQLSGWAGVCGVLWARGEFSDAEFAEVMQAAIRCEVPGHSSPNYPAGTGSIDVGLVEFRLVGALLAPTGEWTGISPRDGTLDGGYCLVDWRRTGSFQGVTESWFRIDAAALESSASRRLVLSTPIELRSVGVTGRPTDPALAGRFWVIELEVPPLDAESGMPVGSVTMRHRFETTDPTQAAADAHRAERNRQVRQGLPAHLREEPQPTPPD